MLSLDGGGSHVVISLLLLTSLMRRMEMGIEDMKYVFDMIGGTSCDTGVVSSPECGDSAVIRLLSIIHNGIILDLLCGFGGSVGEDVRAGFFSVSERKTSFFLWWRP